MRLSTESEISTSTRSRWRAYGGVTKARQEVSLACASVRLAVAAQLLFPLSVASVVATLVRAQVGNGRDA